MMPRQKGPARLLWALPALLALGCSGGASTSGAPTRPPEAEAGEKASREFMKKNMMKNGLTRPPR